MEGHGECVPLAYIKHALSILFFLQAPSTLCLCNRGSWRVWHASCDASQTLHRGDTGLHWVGPGGKLHGFIPSHGHGHGPRIMLGLSVLHVVDESTFDGVTSGKPSRNCSYKSHRVVRRCVGGASSSHRVTSSLILNNADFHLLLLFSTSPFSIQA